MKHYEYRYEALLFDSLADSLNAFGLNGWRLVEFSGSLEPNQPSVSGFSVSHKVYVLLERGVE